MTPAVLRKKLLIAKTILMRDGIGGLINRLARRGRNTRLEKMLDKGPLPLVSWLPWIVQLELTNRCNLRCTSCSAANLPVECHCDMSLEMVRSILDQLPVAVDIHLNGIGESLLNRSFFEILAEVDRRGHAISFITNGMLLSAAAVEKLSHFANLRYIGVSLDGGTAAINEISRPGIVFERVTSNILHARSNLKADIGLHFTVNTANASYFTGLCDFARSNGIKKVSAAGIFIWNDEMSSKAVDYPSFCAIAGSEEELRLRYPGIEINVMLKNRFNRRNRPHCNQPWRFLFIAADGAVFPCCMEFGERLGIIGSLKHHSLREIWNSAQAQAFRVAAHAGTSALCDRCHLR